jgi:MFS family permease
MGRQIMATPAAATKTPAYAWVVLFSIYIATLAAPLNQFKVPPLMPILMDAFKLSYAGAGRLMSIFSIMGFVLAIPAGFIVRRIGIKATGMIALGATMAGAAMGASAHTPALLFSGRFIEGVGMGLIMVAGPSAISLWFPADKRALPMGIWASSVGIAYIAALILAPPLAATYNWQAVWWVGTAVAAIAFVIFCAFFRLPKPEEMSEVATQAGLAIVDDGSASLARAMANRDLWLLGITFGCFNIVILGINSFYADYLNTVRQYSLANASFISSLVMVASIFCGLLSGHVSDRLGSRKFLIVGPLALIGALFFLPFNITGWMIPAFTIALGILAGPIVPVLLATVPEVMPSIRLAGMGTAVAMLCQNFGMFLGPIVFGQMLELTNKNWALTGYAMIPICAIGVVTASLARIR